MSRTRSVVVSALMAAILVAAKYALDSLPNIELVSLIIILYTLEFPRCTLPAVYTYVFVYGLLNGFGIWWIPQLYIWLILVFAVYIMRKSNSVIIFSIISAIFGLSYGALYAVSYAVMNGGIAAGFAWWITGIPFDLLHCVGNFITALLLFVPLRKALQRAKQALVNKPI